MKNCIILGSGRSGTSMLAGTLARSGYFMGDNLYPPRESNPKGFFEDPYINGINEEIIASALCLGPLESLKRRLINKKLTDGQRWLDIIPQNARFTYSESISQKIVEAVSRAPFCFKDPRFSYTLPVWRPHLKDTVFICVFREPAVTASSIVKECELMPYLSSVRIDIKSALKVWYSIYSHILFSHAKEGDWLFLHYDQVLSLEGIAKVEAITGAIADRSFPDCKLKRTSSMIHCPPEYQAVYKQLCKLACFDLLNREF